MPAPQVSVVLNTFNRRRMLEEAVQSVVDQTLAEWELLIVDDASSDDTWAWIMGLDDPRIRRFRQEVNRERCAARNWGLTEARGEFVLFLDDDDRLRPNALQILSAPLAARPDTVAAVGGRWKFRPGRFGVQIPHSPVAVRRVIWPELLSGWSAVPGQSLYRTSVVREIGGFRDDEKLVDDRQLWLAVARKGLVAIVPQTTLEYREHDGQSRPADLPARRLRIYQAFQQALPAPEQARARRIRSAGASQEQAVIDYSNRRTLAALRGYARALRAAPELFLSPLTGPLWLRGLAKALLGPLWRPPRLG